MLPQILVSLCALLTAAPVVDQEPPPAADPPPRPHSIALGEGPSLASSSPAEAEADDGAPELGQGAPPAHGLTFLPLESRTDLLPFVEDHVPGAYRDSNWGGLRIQGGSARETRQSLDGIRLRALRVPLLALGRLDVLAVGLGAAHADVTGGELAFGSASASTSPAVAADLSLERGPFDKQRVELATFTPLPGRLDVVAALQASRRIEDAPLDPTGFFATPPDRRQIEGRTFLKLGWRPTDGHRLELLGATHHGRLDPSELGQALEVSQVRFDDKWLLGAVRWEARTSRLRTGARVSLEHDELHEGPRNCPGARGCEEPTILQEYPQRLMLGPYPWDRARGRTSLELAGHLEVALPSPSPGLELGLRLVPRVRSDSWRWRQSVAGNVLTEYQGSVPLSRTQFFANDPRLDPEQPGAFESRGRSDELVTALEAPLALHDRLHVVPGIAVVGGRLHRGDEAAVADAAVAHVLRAAWQPLGRWPLWLRASTARRVDGDLTYGVEATRPDQISRRCRFDQASQQFDRECEYLGGSRTTVGLPCGPTGLGPDGRPCAETLQLPRMWEHFLGAQASLPWGLRSSVDLVERRTDRTWKTLETNRIWNTTGTAITGYRNGRAETVLDVGAWPQLPRRHRGITAVAAKMGHLGELQLAYTWMRSHGDLSRVGFVSAWGDVGGPLQPPPPVARHFLHLRGVLDLGPASVGALYRYAQGDAYLRQSSIWTTNAFEGYRAARGVNPGTNLNDPSDDRSLRRPDEHDLHVQVRLRGKRLTGVDADLYLDVLEIIHNRREVTPDGRFLSAEPPRLWRLGLEVRH